MEGMQAWRRYGMEGDSSARQVYATTQRAFGEVRSLIVQRISYLQRNGRTSIQLQLNPPEMGRVRLEIEAQGDRVAVRMSVENAEVREEMSRHLGTLGRSLRDVQVDVNRLEVTDYQTGPRGGRQAWADEGRSGGQPGGGSAPPEDTRVHTWTRVTDSGSVDCLI
jgi:flagellar hook-length control protein FliK